MLWINSFVSEEIPDLSFCEGNIESHPDYWDQLFELTFRGELKRVCNLLHEHSFLKNAMPAEDEELYEIIKILKDYQEFYAVQLDENDEVTFATQTKFQ